MTRTNKEHKKTSLKRKLIEKFFKMNFQRMLSLHCYETCKDAMKEKLNTLRRKKNCFCNQQGCFITTFFLKCQKLKSIWFLPRTLTWLLIRCRRKRLDSLFGLMAQLKIETIKFNEAWKSISRKINFHRWYPSEFSIENVEAENASFLNQFSDGNKLRTHFFLWGKM